MPRLVRSLAIASMAIFVVIFSFGAGFGLSQSLGQVSVPTSLIPNASNAATKVQDGGLKLGLIQEIWQVLSDEYVDKTNLDANKLTDGAINGLIETLGDAHTSYINAQHVKEEMAAFRGSFDGVGAQVAMQDKQIIIIAPIAGSPAEKAGIKAGDRILAVNGEPTDKMTLMDAVNRIRGPRGTKVKLGIIHAGDTTPLVIEVVRDEIKTPSVSMEILPDNIAHIIISHFSERTNDEIKPLLQDAKTKKVAGIILDLRNNPGGLLDVTVDVTSQFMKSGVVLYQVDGTGKRQAWVAKSGGLATDTPLAILVNKNSASGSEVLAGALQDVKRGALIGTTTFGKGAVNHLRELSDGSALYVTFARWLTPNGRLIEGQGLTPDIEIDLTEEDVKANNDAQLKRAINYIKNGQ